MDRVNDSQRHLKGELENNSTKPKDLTKNGHSGIVKKSQLTLSQRMLKKGESLSLLMMMMMR